ncbi:MAG: glycoside hydrolase family 127 protein [Bacteroidales bacterium]|nr:glycoside hydrolase family 127 protein [Bacteroidales bacterium]
MRNKPIQLPRMPFVLVLTLGLMTASGCQSDNTDTSMYEYTLLPAGEVIPGGWIREQMKADLKEGITGNLDMISDNVNGNLFVNANRIPGTKVMGNRGSQEKAWWAGEHEGYWKDGVIRIAFATEDTAFIERSHQWVNDILRAEQKNGYIGVYTEKSRFPDKGFDGEFWTQSRIFQGLLAYYEITGKEEVLEAVERTVHKTIDHYRNSTYFGRPGPDGGVQHGLGYMDTLEWLYRLTGDPYYKEAAIWLYEDFNEKGNFEDLKSDNLLNEKYKWVGHTPHIMEGLHLPVVTGAYKQDESYLRAADRVLELFDYHSNPGGGVVGISKGKYVESVNEMMGSGNLASEYCTIMEGISSFNRFFTFTGDLTIGDRIERATLNAAQGARFHQANTAIIYMSQDNCLRADDMRSKRELFSASHTAAICCPLSSGRVMPYYLEGMWYKKNDGKTLLNNLYGPSELKTNINGRDIEIVQETGYPFSDRITYRISTEKTVRFNLEMRIPPNSAEPDITTSNNALVSIDDKRILIEGKWKDGDIVEVDFNFQVNQKLQNDQKEAYYMWGPLVFSLEIEDQTERVEEIVTNSGLKSGFYDYSISPLDTSGWYYQAGKLAPFEVNMKDSATTDNPWSSPSVYLEGALMTPENQPVNVRLVPLGSTILRRTTFPLTES